MDDLRASGIFHIVPYAGHGKLIDKERGITSNPGGAEGMLSQPAAGNWHMKYGYTTYYHFPGKESTNEARTAEPSIQVQKLVGTR